MWGNQVGSNKSIKTQAPQIYSNQDEYVQIKRVPLILISLIDYSGRKLRHAASKSIPKLTFAMLRFKEKGRKAQEAQG